MTSVYQRRWYCSETVLRLAFRLATAALLLALTPAAVAAEVTVTVAARAGRQGELLVATVKTSAQATGVKVLVFEKSLPAFRRSATSWQALIGIDLAQPAGRYEARVVADLPDGTEAATTTTVVVAERAFRTRRLSVAPDYVNPPPELAARIASEQTFIQNLYAHPDPARLWTGPFVRPVPGAANSSFGTRSVFNGEARNPHAGTDFLSGTGTPIKAPAGGRIVASRELFFTGYTVILDHGMGLFSVLAHLSRTHVREGDTVRAGDVVGLVGATGRVTGAHLHWSLLASGARVDPLSALALLGPAAKK